MTIRSIGRIAKQPVALFNGGLERYEQALLADQAGPHSISIVSRRMPIASLNGDGAPPAAS